MRIPFWNLATLMSETSSRNWRIRLRREKEMSKLTDIMRSTSYKDLESDIEEFVKEKLEGYKPDRIGKKTIRDSVWGSIEYSEWEMQVIDSLLFQRLRDISQVGLASLTYPAARHSRFEHSLGVAAAAKKICE